MKNAATAELQGILQPSQQAEILQELEDSEGRSYSSGLSMCLRETYSDGTRTPPEGHFLFLLN